MLYHFQIELSDVDRSVYTSLDFRIVQHPSEIGAYLLSRALAYALSYREDLEFSPSGLGDPEAPAMMAKTLQGAIELWVEIGNPSARKLHKAGKAAEQVRVFTYKNAEALMKEIRDEKVHRGSEIQVYALDLKFLERLEKQLQKNNRWIVLHQQGQIDVGLPGGETFTTEVRELRSDSGS